MSLPKRCTKCEEHLDGLDVTCEDCTTEATKELLARAEKAEALCKRLVEALEGVLPFVLFIPMMTHDFRDGLASKRNATEALAEAKK